MTRWKLTIEYDGGPFSGWQRQTDLPSVQGAIEDAVFAFCGERIAVHGAGRTDAGVHARGQVAHIDLARDWTPKTVRDALNAHLRPAPVVILSAEVVENSFEARFSATHRAYRYVIVNRMAGLALEHGRAWHVKAALDEAAMQDGARHLLGKHDFTTFRAAGCQAKSPIRTVDQVDVVRNGERVIIDVAARSFLHSQVRAFVGTLKLVGEGKWHPDDVASALTAQDRTRCGTIAPADGLYLMAVRY